jgi:phosphate transport system permease protein
MTLQLPLARRLKDSGFKLLCGVAAATALCLLLGVLLTILTSAWPALSLSFVTEQSRRGGEQGGVFFQVVGTCVLALTAASIAVPFSLGLALLQSEYMKAGLTRRLLSGSLFLLNGVPSIVFGVVGFFVLVKACGLQKSWFAGGVVLAFMILPTVTVAVSDAISRIPAQRREAALALGLNSPKVIWSLVVPSSLPGLATGILLGLARAAGETAPIMFTAAVFSGADWPVGVVDSPVVALPYHVLVLAQDASSPAVLQNAWGAAALLVAMSLVLSSLAWLVRRRSSELCS